MTTASKIKWEENSYPHNSHEAFHGGYELGVGPSFAHKGQLVWNVRVVGDPWDLKKLTICSTVDEGKKLAEAEVRQLLGED
jgi:hypothetical protein